MNRLSDDMCREFLSYGCRTAKLATVRQDGRPHVAPVWFVLDGEDLVLMTHQDSVNGRTLLREPRVMISVDDEEFPFGFVLVEGIATCERLEPKSLLPWSLRIATRYVPDDALRSTADRNSVDGKLLVRVQITNLIGMTDVAA